MDERTRGPEALKRRRARSSFLVVALVVTAPAAGAATLTPTTTADQYDTVADGECSLREAVESANANADFGGCVAVGVYGDDVIVLGAGTYVLDLGPPEDPSALDNSVGDLDVEPGDVESLDVTGAGSDATIVERADAAARFRVFQADVPALLRLVDLTVRNGFSEFGGGIASEGFSLVLERVVVRDNVAEASEGQGGGIWALGEVLSLADSLITANRSTSVTGDLGCGTAGGGGIFAVSCLRSPLAAPGISAHGSLAARAEVPATALLLIERTTISNNAATATGIDCTTGGGGAAILETSALVEPGTAVSRLVNSTVSGNSAAVGGGIAVASGDPGSICPVVLLRRGARAGSSGAPDRRWRIAGPGGGGSAWREVQR